MKLLIDEEGKYMFFDESDERKDIHTRFGIISRNDIMNAKQGNTIKSKIGKKFVVLEANFADKFETIKRGPQIITLKDAAIIAAFMGISLGYKIIEAGSGSGALTSYLANIVKPTGKIYSYERREDFLKIAKENVKMFGLSKFVEFKNKSTHDGIEEKNVDAVILDMPDPWNSIKNAENALKTGGFLACYLPNLIQVEELLQKAKETSFKLTKVSRVTLKDAGRKLKFKSKIRKDPYIVFMRKLPFD